jgi:hypothetical protein
MTNKTIRKIIFNLIEIQITNGRTTDYILVTNLRIILRYSGTISYNPLKKNNIHNK